MLYLQKEEVTTGATNEKTCPLCWKIFGTKRGVLRHLSEIKDEAHKGWSIVKEHDSKRHSG